MTIKQIRTIILEIIQELLLSEITALRAEVRELRKNSHKTLEEVRGMRLEFRHSMEHLTRQLERLTKTVDERLPEEEADNPATDFLPFPGTGTWAVSAGSGIPNNLNHNFSPAEIQNRLNQMEHRLGMLEKALQRN